MTPYRLTIYLQPSDLKQFFSPAPERPQDVVVTFKWQAEKGWPVGLTINPDDFTFHDLTLDGAKVKFGRDLTEEEHRVQTAKIRAHAREMFPDIVFPPGEP